MVASKHTLLKSVCNIFFSVILSSVSPH